MVIEFDMNEPDYLSSLCMGDPFAYIDSLEQGFHIEYINEQNSIEDYLY